MDLVSHPGISPLLIVISPVSRTPSFWTSVMLVFHCLMLLSMNVISTGWILYIWRDLSIREWGTLSKAFLKSIQDVDKFFFLFLQFSKVALLIINRSLHPLQSFFPPLCSCGHDGFYL